MIVPAERDEIKRKRREDYRFSQFHFPIPSLYFASLCLYYHAAPSSFFPDRRLQYSRFYSVIYSSQGASIFQALNWLVANENRDEQASQRERAEARGGGGGGGSLSFFSSLGRHSSYQLMAWNRLARRDSHATIRAFASLSSLSLRFVYSLQTFRLNTPRVLRTIAGLTVLNISAPSLDIMFRRFIVLAFRFL